MFLTDTILYLDILLDNTLLVKPGVDRVSQAAEEAQRLKRLMGSLRYLFRNSDWVKHLGEEHFEV